ncbi:MAG: hypothetical protein ACRDIU_07885 [Actinomycetota bacterium]
MKQLQVREPWAGLAYKGNDPLLEELLHRIQVLEARVRDLESKEFEIPVSEEVSGREAMPVGV